MIPLALSQIALLSGGKATPGAEDALVTGPVVIDSRAVVPGALFVALRGERADGHDFAPKAVGRGAAALVCEGTPLPCGMCLQAFAEFAGPDLPMLLATPDGKERRVRLGDLLPQAFDLPRGS
ncbi:MAG: Mur ligase domain-containing protein [Limnochordales bacterium]